MKIGLIDLDTSHPGSWVPLLRELGHEVTCVFDSGDVHPPEYAGAFARQHGIAHVCAHLEELADAVDLGIVHSSDWDQHIARARPLVERGKAVLIDKPLAGKLADLRLLEHWAQRGVRLAGGSALWLCDEAVTPPASDRPTTVITSCGLGPFDYGIHAYALLLALMGGEPAPLAVRHLGDGRDGRVIIDWPDGRAGIIVCGHEQTWMPFLATVIDPRASRQIAIDGGKLYRAYLSRVLPYLCGRTDQPAVNVADLVQAERCALAARVSQRRQGQPVELARFDDDLGGFDGQAFARRYRALKYPAAAVATP